MIVAAAKNAAGNEGLVLLAAHGERAGEAANRRLAVLSNEVGALLPGVDTAFALVNERDTLEAQLSAAGERSVVVLPILFSDGYFYSQRLKPLVGGVRQRLAPPLAMWGGFPALLGDAIERTGIGRSARVLLVAHGSKQPGQSSATARQLADQLSLRFGRVHCAFLEEPPYASEAAGRAGSFDVLVGLFFGEGLHGGTDFRMLAALNPSVPAFTVGDLPGLAELVAIEAKARLATIPHS